RVALGDLQITGLNAKVIRTSEGISLSVLPGAAAANPPAASASRQESRPAGADAPQATVRPPAEVSLDSLQLRGANLMLEDRTVKPVFNGKIAPLAIDARGIRWPELAVAQLRINGSTQRGKISVSGALAHNKGQFTVTTDDLALTPFNPYATTLAGYRIGKGKASVTTKVTIADGRYDARNALVLHDLNVHGAGGESGFQQTFGLPISMALALMRDPNGDIALDIPVQIDREGVRVGVWEVIRGAIKRAIIGALTAPLKLLGAVFGGGGKVEAVAPTSLVFRPGRDELTPDGTQQAEQFAQLLSSRPALSATLSTAVSETDARWLSEQALRAEWDKEGFFGKLKDLPQRSARNAVSRALEARAQDQEGKLDPEDAAALERWLNERPPPSEAQLQRLSEARLARVEQLLQARGVESRRLTRGTIGDTPVPESPAVSVELSPGA
ncbi:MAG TPA: DUF748 domain-containing protein, partial [Anaerolineales bacterium]|nr:DUF748 domain-containing protein [Anaerolineales bacterium]